MAFFISAAIVFNVGVYLYLGSTAGLEFTTGYLMELMLSVDNLFVIILIFTPSAYRGSISTRSSSTASWGHWYSG